MNTVKISDEEIKLLADSCQKIRSIKTKQSESRSDYVNLFGDFHDLYTHILTCRDEEFTALKDKTIKRPDFTKGFVKELRQRQEGLGVEKYLINDVKFGFISNIVHWVQNPELQAIKREYKPRNKDNAGNNSKKKKKESEIKITAFTSTSASFQITNQKNDEITLVIAINEDQKIPIMLSTKKMHNIELKIESTESGKL